MTKLRKMAAIGLTLGILFGCTACDSKPGGSAASSAGEAAQTEAASASAPALTPSGTWSLAGNFLDESENHLMIYKTSVEFGDAKDGYGAMVLMGEALYTGDLDELDGALTGTVSMYNDDGTPGAGMDITLTVQGEGVLMKTGEGAEYSFAPDDTDYTAAAGEMLPYFQYNEIYGADGFDAVDAAAYDYLAFEAEKDYEPSHVMLPCVTVVDVDESNPEDVLIYGDYWLWECAKEEDTLAVVAGGHRPGIIHAQRFGEGETAVYSATSFDEALTDQDLEPLFGERYDAYTKVASDAQATEEKTAKVAADYVRTNGLEITKFQLPGGTPVDLS